MSARRIPRKVRGYKAPERYVCTPTIGINIKSLCRSLDDLTYYMDRLSGLSLPQIAAAEQIELRFMDLPEGRLSESGKHNEKIYIALDHSLSDEDQREQFMVELLNVISHRSVSYLNLTDRFGR